MANWSMMKRSILIGYLSGPNIAVQTAHKLISPNSFYETLDRRKLFSIKKKHYSFMSGGQLWLNF